MERLPGDLHIQNWAVRLTGLYQKQGKRGADLKARLNAESFEKVF